jgi:hypothetical protein
MTHHEVSRAHPWTEARYHSPFNNITGRRRNSAALEQS